MSAKPLVSVCISAYNNEDVLRETVESVLAQTYENLEVVLRDDGSSDATAEVVRSVDDDRVRAIVGTGNLGGYQSMNHVISLARGEFVAVYHSDDVYDPAIVEREVEYLLQQPKAGAVFTLDHYLGEDGVVFGGTSLPVGLRGRDLLTYDDVFPYIVRNKNTFIRCPTFMTRRSTLEDVGGFDPETWESGSDLEMWLRLARRHPVGIIDQRLVSYRVRQDNWTARYERLRTEEERFFAVVDHYLELDGWRERLRPEDLREYAFHRCDDETQRAANHVIRGELTEARTLLERRYPAETFLRGMRRRKLRVVLLRAAMKAGLALRARRPLTRFLVAVQYRGRLG